MRSEWSSMRRVVHGETEKRASFRPRGKTDVRAAGLALVFTPGMKSVPGAIPLHEGVPLVIGREPTPGGLTISDPSISRMHARVSNAGETITVIDLGSRNGILVNGELVEKAELNEGDELRVGDAIFKLVLDDIEGYSRTHPADPLLVEQQPFVGGYRMSKVREQIARVAPSALSILVRGETGSGKELASRAIHEVSGRTGKFAALNCAAIPANLVESELFGFRRGAFTGADRDHIGLVRSAHGGTLLLDEIGDMPLDAQAKLLRVIETREVFPLGSTTPERVDVRIVAATHRDLRTLIADGRFRGDLFARLDGFTLELPPLRARKEDLYPLVRYFLGRCGRPDAEPTIDLMAALVQHSWPYNVRELEAVVRRCVTLAAGGPLAAGDLPSSILDGMLTYGEARSQRNERAAPPASTIPSDAPPEMRGRTPVETLRTLLERHRGNVSAVARDLGKDRALVYRWIRQGGIEPDTFRNADPDASNEPRGA